MIRQWLLPVLVVIETKAALPSRGMVLSWVSGVLVRCLQYSYCRVASRQSRHRCERALQSTYKGQWWILSWARQVFKQHFKSVSSTLVFDKLDPNSQGFCRVFNSNLHRETLQPQEQISQNCHHLVQACQKPLWFCSANPVSSLEPTHNQTKPSAGWSSASKRCVDPFAS